MARTYQGNSRPFGFSPRKKVEINLKFTLALADTFPYTVGRQ